MTTPAFAALLWLGELPSLRVIVLGIVTTFAGYTAVYALNDVVDYRQDRKKVSEGGFYEGQGDLDAVLVRHPMAQGLVSLTTGVLWTLGWATVAALGAWLLNPVCLAIFVGGCLLETAYCLLWNVSPYRTLVSGAVKTSGALAAVFAVDPHPSFAFLAALFACLFCWEVGGQNVPNDWTDVEEDRRQAAKTIPVRLGPERTAHVIVAALALTLVLVGVLFNIGRRPADPVFALAAMAACAYLLLVPAAALLRHKGRVQAMALFNRASYFPAVMGAVALLNALF
jgi:4-hydroxybenzoate polyprenyltransferase